jgi:curved DNA-binding protein
VMAVGFRDYYETLGVGRDATAEEIRAAYRRLARQYHPDLNKDAGAEDKFKEVSEAYEVLSDPQKREQYDQLGASWRSGDDVSGAEGFGGGGRPGASGVEFDFGTGDFSDFFESLFGSRRPRPETDGFSLRGRDQEATLELSLEEAAVGGRRRFSLADGREYQTNIPAGVADGQRIRLAGKGESGVGDGPPGDLFLRIQLRPHPNFRLEGRDLYVDLALSPWEAALGAQVPVPTLSGSSQVRVPEGSPSGRKLRLRGQGMPSTGGDQGDLYATVKIDVPRQLTTEEREAFERLRSVSSFNPRERGN